VHADHPYSPGVAPDPFPIQAEQARVKIPADQACAWADDLTKPRNYQLAAWVECAILGNLFTTTSSTSTTPSNDQL